MFGIISLIALGGVNSVLWFSGVGGKVANTLNWVKKNYKHYLGPAIDRFYGIRPPSIYLKRIKTDNSETTVKFEFSSIKIIETRKEVEESIDAENISRKEEATANNLSISTSENRINKEFVVYENENKKSSTVESNKKGINYNSRPTYKVFLTVPKGTYIGEIDFTNWQTQEDFKVTIINEKDGKKVSSVEYAGVLATLQKMSLALGQEKVLLYPDQKVEDVTEEVVFNTGFRILDFSGNQAVDAFDYLLDKIRVGQRKLRDAYIEPDKGRDSNLECYDFANRLAVLLSTVPEEKAKSILDHYYGILLNEIDNELYFIRKEKNEAINDVKDIQESQKKSYQRLKFFGRIFLIGVIVGFILIGVAFYFSSVLGSVFSGIIISALIAGACYVRSLIFGMSLYDVLGIVLLGGIAGGVLKIKDDLQEKSLKIGQDLIKVDEEGEKNLNLLKESITEKRLDTQHILVEMNRLVRKDTGKTTLSFAGKKISYLDISIICEFFIRKLEFRAMCKIDLLDLHGCNIVSDDINGLIVQLMKLETNQFMIKKLDLKGNIVAVREIEILLKGLEDNNFTLTDIQLDVEQYMDVDLIKRIKIQLLINRYLQGEEFLKFTESEQKLFSRGEQEIEEKIIAKLHRTKITELPFAIIHNDTKWSYKLSNIITHKREILKLADFDIDSVKNHDVFVEYFLSAFKYGGDVQYTVVLLKEKNRRFFRDCIIKNLELLDTLNQEECAKLFYVLFCNGKADDPVHPAAKAIAYIISEKPILDITDSIKKILRELPSFDDKYFISTILMNRLNSEIYLSARKTTKGLLFAEKVDLIIQKFLEAQLIYELPFLRKYIKDSSEFEKERRPGCFLKSQAVDEEKDELLQLGRYLENNFFIRNIEFCEKISGPANDLIKSIICRNNIVYFVEKKDIPELVNIIKIIPLDKIEDILYVTAKSTKNICENIIDLLLGSGSELEKLDIPHIVKVITICFKLIGKESRKSEVVAEVIGDIIKIGYREILGDHSCDLKYYIYVINKTIAQKKDSQLVAILNYVIQEDLKIRYSCLKKSTNEDFESLKKELEHNHDLTEFKFDCQLTVNEDVANYVNSILIRNKIEVAAVAGKGPLINCIRTLKQQDVPKLKMILKEKCITELRLSDILLKDIFAEDVKEINNIIIGNEIHTCLSVGNNKEKLKNFIDNLKSLHSEQLTNCLSGLSPDDKKIIFELIKSNSYCVFGEGFFVELIKQLEVSSRIPLLEWCLSIGEGIEHACGIAILISSLTDIEIPLNEYVWHMFKYDNFIGSTDRWSFKTYIKEVKKIRDNYKDKNKTALVLKMDVALHTAMQKDLVDRYECLKNPSSTNIIGLDKLKKELVDAHDLMTFMFKGSENEQVKYAILSRCLKNKIRLCVDEGERSFKDGLLSFKKIQVEINMLIRQDVIPLFAEQLYRQCGNNSDIDKLAELICDTTSDPSIGEKCTNYLFGLIINKTPQLSFKKSMLDIGLLIREAELKGMKVGERAHKALQRAEQEYIKGEFLSSLLVVSDPAFSQEHPQNFSQQSSSHSHLLLSLDKRNTAIDKLKKYLENDLDILEIGVLEKSNPIAVTCIKNVIDRNRLYRIIMGHDKPEDKLVKFIEIINGIYSVEKVSVCLQLLKKIEDGVLGIVALIDFCMVNNSALKQLQSLNKEYRAELFKCYLEIKNHRSFYIIDFDAQKTSELIGTNATRDEVIENLGNVTKKIEAAILRGALMI